MKTIIELEPEEAELKLFIEYFEQRVKQGKASPMDRLEETILELFTIWRISNRKKNARIQTTTITPQKSKARLKTLPV